MRKAKSKTEITAYRALVGLSYGDDSRVEAGDIVSDLPAESIAWLLEQGQIEPVKENNDGETRA
jgi:hypothetical protein